MRIVRYTTAWALLLSQVVPPDPDGHIKAQCHLRDLLLSMYSKVRANDVFVRLMWAERWAVVIVGHSSDESPISALLPAVRALLVLTPSHNLPHIG